MNRKILLGTDWWTDCDDCVAVRLLANAHKAGEIELCGVVLNACMEDSAPSLSAFLTGEGLRDLPIGIDLAGTDFAGDYFRYQKPLCAYPHRIQKNEDCPDGVELYRRVLTESDGKVDIVEIGFYQVLANLLRSPDGTQLVRERSGASTPWRVNGTRMADGNTISATTPVREKRRSICAKNVPCRLRSSASRSANRC